MKTLTILTVLLAAACDGGSSKNAPVTDSYDNFMEVSEEQLVSVPSAHSKGSTQENVEKKLVRTGGLSYSVESTREEYKRLLSLFEQYDAYIASENESKGYDRINYNMSVKVPPKNFGTLITSIAEDRKVESRWVNTNDVTERYYDLQSRINNKKKLETRYQEILQKAQNVRDILEVERNLNQVRGEIESLQGQFKLLSHQVTFSTLDLSFFELIPYEIDGESRPGFGKRMINSISSGWQGFLTFLVYLLALWPFGLLTIAVVWIIKRVRSKRKKADL